MNAETVLIPVLTAFLTYIGTKRHTEYQLRGTQVEADANTEGMYVQNMSLILTEYKEQVSGFRSDLLVVREENAEIKRSFAAFKDQHYKEIGEYKIYIEELEESIEELKEENSELRLEVAYLKGENECE